MDIVKELLSRGADINANYDKAGIVPLYAAAAAHNVQGVRALIHVHLSCMRALL